MPNYGYLINKALKENMAANDKIILLGEDICMPYGGAFKITYNLSTLYPDRVINMPISESGMIGFATGLAIAGYLPVVEIMFGDFLTLCFDQIYNHAAKFEWMYGVKIPMIIRTPMGGYRGYGPTHSQSIEKHFLGIPGLDVYALNEFVDPLEFYDFTFKNIDNPTLVIENKMLYGQKLSTRYQPSNPKVSIIAYGGSVSLVKQAIEKSGVECELCDIIGLQSIIRNPKSDNIIIVEEGNTFGSWGTEIAFKIQQSSPNCKIIRIGNNDWIPCAKDQEEKTLPSVEDIVFAIKGLTEKNELIGDIIYPTYDKLKNAMEIRGCLNFVDIHLIYGDGGHAKCIKDILGNEFVHTITGDEWKDERYVGDIILGVGLIKKHPKRGKLFNEMKEMGYTFPNVIHKSAQIEPSVKLGQGVQIFANAVIGSDVVIGDNCIINSGAIVSHDCILEDNVHVAPGAILAGGVNVGHDTLIGMGCTVYAGVKIGNNCVIFNGSNLIHDVENCKVYQ